MTHYFDEKHEQFNAILKEGHEKAWEKLRDLECKMVYDVTIASEMPGFPEDLRDQIHAIVLKWGNAALPVNATGPDYESWEEHCAGMNSLTWDLHTIFHEVAKRHLEHFSDDPRCYFRIIYARGEERREQMVEEAKKPV